MGCTGKSVFDKAADMSYFGLLPYSAEDAVTGKACPAALTNILEGGFEGKLHSCHPVVPETIASLI